MITKLEVSNYKSIKSLSLEMRPFMVLVGPNGAGKTNVVRSMELLSQIIARGSIDPVREQGWAQVVHREKKPARKGLQLEVTLRMPDPRIFPRYRRTGVLKAARHDVIVRLALHLSGTVAEEVRIVGEELELSTERGTLRVARKNDGGRDPLSIDWGADPVLWSMLTSRSGYEAGELETKARFAPYQSKARQVASGRPTNLCVINTFPITADAENIARLTRLRLDASALRRETRFSSLGRDVLGPTGEGLPAVVDRLRGHGETPSPGFARVLAGLREVFPRIEDVVPERFGGGRVTLNFVERGIKEPIPLDGVSDGVLHALAILVALEVRAPGVLAIEEPENAIHPWSLKNLVERAQRDPTQQVLLTTHSETVVNAVENPDSLFIVESSDEGTKVVAAKSKEKALESILRESGQKLGDVWMGGSLGGVPG